MKPSFFIVGAHRCGTTAMYTYLRQHPQIFIPELKEIHFFSTDLPWRRGAMRQKINTKEKYLDLFKDAKGGQLIGEANTWDIYSAEAPKKIKEFNPEAKIIIMLRNPVEMIYSFHSMLVTGGLELIDNFEEALAAESKRKAGEKFKFNAPGNWAGMFLYRKYAHYMPFVKNYIDIFGRENVHIIVFDDFKKDTTEAYRQTLRFLGVDDKFTPDFPVINKNAKVRLKFLQRFLNNPPDSVVNIVTKLLPVGFLDWLGTQLRKLNTRAQKRPPMSIQIKRKLKEEFKPDILELEKVLNRNLSNWYTE